MNKPLTKVNNLIIGVTYCVIDEPLLLNCQTRSSKLIAVNMHVSVCKVMPRYYHEQVMAKADDAQHQLLFRQTTII